MALFNRIKRCFACFLINHFFSGTHFFTIKRFLLNLGGIPCGKGTKLVGPIYIGGVSKLSIGTNVWVGRNISIFGNGEVVLENNIDIAPDVAFISGSHEISTDLTRRAGKGMAYTITIGNGCWIGCRVSIMGNTKIGDGCVIGACSLVNKSLKKNCVYAGTPVELIRSLEE